MIPIVITVVRVMLVVMIMMIIRVMMMIRVREWGTERRTSVAWCSRVITNMQTHYKRTSRKEVSDPTNRSYDPGVVVEDRDFRSLISSDCLDALLVHNVITHCAELR